jgi:hypothetical protein
VKIARSWAKALIEAVARQDIEAARAALERGASPNIRHNHHPLLCTPILGDNLAMVKVLRRHGAHMESVLEDGTQASRPRVKLRVAADRLLPGGILGVRAERDARVAAPPFREPLLAQ